MQIGSRLIGLEHPPYVIAELGVNHDGSPERAIELTDAAANAGADAIKLQLFKADLLMSKAAKLAAYQRAAGESDPVEMLRRLELSIEQMAPVVERAHARGIHAIVTVFSTELVGVAERLPWDAYKTASPDIIHRPLLEALMATGRPMIVSTGASTLEEVERAVEWLRPAHGRLAVLQCVSSYPTPWSQAAFGGVMALARIFDGPVGYSDHTDSAAGGAWAVLAGATVLEKHLTYDRRASGPDHAASLTPGELRTYVESARRQFEVVRGLKGDERWTRPLLADDPEGLRGVKVRELLGPVEKVVLDIERDVRAVSRQSLTTTSDLPAGHTLTRADITFKRPGTGIPPFELVKTLGRRLARRVEAGMTICDSDLAPV